MMRRTQGVETGRRVRSRLLSAEKGESKDVLAGRRDEEASSSSCAICRTTHRQGGHLRKLPSQDPDMRYLLLIAALAPAPALADCKDEIKDIMDRSGLAGPYRTEATVKSETRSGVVTSDIVPPHGLRTRSVVAGKTRELLKIGPQIWANEGGGWKELPP